MAVLTILNRLRAQSSELVKLSMIYENLMAEIRMLVPREQVSDLDTLLTLTKKAKKLIAERENYIAPPPPEKCLLPQLAYREKTGTTKKAAGTHVASIEAQADGTPVLAITAAVKEALAQLGVSTSTSTAQSQPEVQSPKAKRKGRFHRKSREKSESSVTITDVTEGEKAPRKAKSTHNKDQKEKGKYPSFVFCYGCGWPQHIKRTCPECSKKEQGNENGGK